MTNIGLTKELVKANIAMWFLNKNTCLCNVACVTEWFLTVVAETEKAVKVAIYDTRKKQTAENTNWTMWMPKSALGCLNK